jgi:hypothetical protein
MAESFAILTQYNCVRNPGNLLWRGPVNDRRFGEAMLFDRV